jgi:hypothetical protein
MGAGKMAIIMKINGFGGVYGLNEDYELLQSTPGCRLQILAAPSLMFSVVQYAHLLAGEGRLTLREERADALDKIAGAPSLALEVCLEIELGIEIVGQ